jgi:pimeloyl-ACP methyl ester carboxylesterase
MAVFLLAARLLGRYVRGGAKVRTTRVVSSQWRQSPHFAAPGPLQELLAQHLRTAKLAILPDLGHSAYGGQPDRFNRMMLELIKEY